MKRLPKAGDHIRVSRKFYAHDAIYVGDGQVIHFWGVTKNKADGRIQISPLEEFLAGADKLDIIEYAACFGDAEVVSRAYKCLGDGDYNFLLYNCQHFARWCKTGHCESDQIERAVTLATGASVARLASSLAVAAAGAAAAPGTTGAAAIMSGLAGAGGSAVGGVAMVAGAPAVAAVVATHRALRDDSCLSNSERTARSAGRRASTAGAIGGTGLSLAFVSIAGVPGLGAAGITSGLTALGGSMLGGLFVVGFIPVVTTALGGMLVYKARKRRDS